jgi:hypothetical protein
MRSLVAPYRWRGAVIRPAIAGGAFWLLAILAIVAVYFSPRHLISAQTAVTGLVGFCLLAIAARWPDRSLLALIIVLPFSGFILAKLWALGVPTSIVRHLSAWKETLALGVIVAGARNFIATGRRADAVDRLALGLVGIIVLYILGQKVLAPSDHASMGVRELAFRDEAGFVLLLLGARHAPLPDNFLRRASGAALAVAIVVAGASVFEALDSSAWNRFVVNTIQYTRYQVGVLHGSPPNPYDIRLYGTIGGTRFIRTGSVFDSALSCGFYLVLGFALGLERAARGRGGRWILPALILIGAGLLLTQTRSAILAALIVAWLAFRPAAGRRRHWRTQLAFVAAALAIAAVPAAISTGLSKRITAPTGNTDNAGHISAFWSGVHSIEHHPFGTGLATSAGAGQTYQQTSGVVVPENNYLQVGVELGVVGGLVFVALTVALVLSLRRAARRRPDPAIAAAAAAMAGLAVAAWFLETWFDFSVAWTMWGFAGAALGASRVRVAQRQEAAAPPAHNAPQPLPA